MNRWLKNLVFYDIGNYILNINIHKHPPDTGSALNANAFVSRLSY